MKQSTFLFYCTSQRQFVENDQSYYKTYIDYLLQLATPQQQSEHFQPISLLLTLGNLLTEVS